MNMAATNSSVTAVKLDDLFLDPNNYRLIHEKEQANVPDEKIMDKQIVQRTFRLLVGERNQHIQDLIDSFRTNGWLPVDQIQVQPLAGTNAYVVVEGNRRVAALKYLQSEFEAKSIDLGKLDPQVFQAVPVVLYTDADKAHYLTLMALKHISGNKKWGEWNQANLLEKLAREHKQKEDVICKSIGITKHELRRSLRALAFMRQYRDSDYGDNFQEAQFPIFREVVRAQDLKEWLGWDEEKHLATNTKNRMLFFSWLSREIADDDSEEGQMLGGAELREPALTRRDDIRVLNDIIKDQRALDYLEKSRDLNGAYRKSNVVFQHRKDDAMNSLAADIAVLKEFSLEKKYLPNLEQATNHLQAIVGRTRGSVLAGVEQSQVYHDQIAAHFSAIDIVAWRKLHGLSLQKLARINLIAGGNNSGKTSLLEAIYLLTRQNDVAGVLETVRRRAKLSFEQMQPAWLKDQLPNDATITGNFDGKASMVGIQTKLEGDASIDRTRFLATIEIATSFGENRQESVTHLFRDGERQMTAEGVKLLCPCVLSSPFFLNEPQHHTYYYSRSVESKVLNQIIIKFLKENILPTLKDIRLVDESQRFLVDDESFKSAMDLTNYGEGLQRIFFMSLVFAAANNGVVLIDEFENAVHADLLPEFSKLVLELAKKFNVQVFLTSHSKEAIDAFSKNQKDAKDFSYHALVQREGKIVALNYDGETFAKLKSLANIDLRRAK